MRERREEPEHSVRERREQQARNREREQQLRDQQMAREQQAKAPRAKNFADEDDDEFDVSVFTWDDDELK